MAKAQQFGYRSVTSAQGRSLLRPLLPLNLSLHNHTVATLGLLDTGADVNVMPYTLGLQLGANWDTQPIPPSLSGNLGAYETKGIVVSGLIADFEPMRLAFSWSRSETVPLLLGQVNFFMHFDVCFFLSSAIFEVSLR